MTGPTSPTRSFRDPAGACCVLEDRVYRFLHNGNVAEFQRFLRSSLAGDLTSRGQLISTRRLSAPEAAALRRNSPAGLFNQEAQDPAVFEHERIWFPSYPHEWPPEMLWAAGLLTLELAQRALAGGFCLKDATPYNVLFRGSEPVFVDVLSFESRVEGDAVWRPYAQFIRTFALPLLCHQKWGSAPADIFLNRRDGLEPHEVYRLCTPLQRLRPPFLFLVSVPTWLAPRAGRSRNSLFEPRPMANPNKAAYVLGSLLNRLRRTLESLEPRSATGSKWSVYMDTHTYSAEAFAAKEQFVQSLLRDFRPARLLDLGANTGHFSKLAAQAGAEVVAVDSDSNCVSRIWSMARQAHSNILPLVVNLGRPSPALGWRNAECASFLDRATGVFDCVLMLALVHHLLVTERIPLDEILKLASELTTSLLVIEFVGPGDAMFQHLIRGRDRLHENLSEASFEQACAARFEILRSLPLPGTSRKLFALKRKGGAH